MAASAIHAIEASSADEAPAAPFDVKAVVRELAVVADYIKHL